MVTWNIWNYRMVDCIKSQGFRDLPGTFVTGNVEKCLFHQINGFHGYYVIYFQKTLNLQIILQITGSFTFVDLLVLLKIQNRSVVKILAHWLQLVLDYPRCILNHSQLIPPEK